MAEILAPAGNKESLKAAIYNGADAVYFGLSNFNARANAENFTLENLNETVEFCHLYNVKAYLAINTLIKNKEIKEALKFVEAALNANIDAFIVADLGLAKLIKEKFSNACLHASTQMGVHNLYGAKILEKLGFSRVILARETKLADIVEIKQNTNLEIEYFVHGALCVAFSGACLLSNSLCEKSGNRGQCTQPCRLNYTLKNENNEIKNCGKLLSTADLCLIKNLNVLLDAGVTSFKIEGRNRRAAYVACAVRNYCQALKAISDKTQLNLNRRIKSLSKAFNRGPFNENAYLYENAKSGIINPISSGHMGVPIGKVIKCENFKSIYKIYINSSHELTQGDGLKIFEKRKEITSLGVGNVGRDKKLQIIYTTQKLRPNQEVYLTLDAKEELKLLSQIKKLKIDLKINFFSGKKGTVLVKYNNLVAKIDTEEALEKAKSSLLEKSDIEKCFNKNKETVFILNNLTFKTDGVFMPVSKLNSLRINVYNAIKNLILSEYKKSQKHNIKQNINIETLNIPVEKISLNNESANIIKSNDIFIIDNINQLEKINNSKATYAFNGDFSALPSFYKTYKQKLDQLNFGPLGIVLPVYASKQDIVVLENLLSKLNKNEIYLITNNLYGLAFIEKGYLVMSGISLSVYNNITDKLLKDLGVFATVSAPDLDMVNENDTSADFSAEGHLPLMNFSHCPFLTSTQIGENCIAATTSNSFKSCNKCGYSKNSKLINQVNIEYTIKRNRLHECTFSLVSGNYLTVENTKNKVKYL